MLVDDGFLPLARKVLIERFDELIVGKKVDLILRENLLAVVSRLRQGAQQLGYLIDWLVGLVKKEALLEGRLDGFQSLDIKDGLGTLHAGIENCLDLQS